MADITNLQFEDKEFEYIICNHVLEHILDEKKAFSEMKRCLKQEGVLILSVPICWQEKTYQNAKIVKKMDRIKYFGQEDHVRLYGNDIVERIEYFGFNVTLLQCKDIATNDDIEHYGWLLEDSVLLCKKR